ncbi:MAG: hypothetical protein JWM33_1054 [Caulobacteraceae bacterium]|nr:hypothetical protein [Caulobacteraceae bacterium]
MALPARYKSPRFLIQLALILPIVALMHYSLQALQRLPHRPHTGLTADAALLTVFLGLLVVVAAFDRKVAPMRRRPMIFGAMATIMCGLSLLLPAYAPQSWSGKVVFMLFVAMTAASYLLHLPYWRAADEMMRQVAIKAEYLGLRIFFFGVLFYAAAAALGIEVYFSLWNFVTVLLLLRINAALWVNIRHYGLAPPEDTPDRTAPA